MISDCLDTLRLQKVVFVDVLFEYLYTVLVV